MVFSSTTLGGFNSCLYMKSLVQRIPTLKLDTIPSNTQSFGRVPIQCYFASNALMTALAG